MDAKTKVLLAHVFQHEIAERAKEVDPENQHDWHSLTIGWAIAKGLRPNDALEFATHIRYATNLG
jgi:hypothetical protein